MDQFCAKGAGKWALQSGKLREELIDSPVFIPSLRQSGASPGACNGARTLEHAAVSTQSLARFGVGLQGLSTGPHALLGIPLVLHPPLGRAGRRFARPDTESARGQDAARCTGGRGAVNA